MPLKLIVNKEAKTIDAAPDTPLLWVLRDHLNLKGAKYGCGIGVCGACTVLIDGRPVRSCMTHAGSVAGQQITTIEGLSPEGQHAVQKAWEEVDVAQCGYSSRDRSWRRLRYLIAILTRPMPKLTRL